MYGDGQSQPYSQTTFNMKNKSHKVKPSNGTTLKMNNKHKSANNSSMRESSILKNGEQEE